MYGGDTPPVNSAQGVMYGHTPPASSAQGVMFGLASISHHPGDYNEVTAAEFNDVTEHNNHQVDAANDKVQTVWSTRRHGLVGFNVVCV
jgi:hypothetical protein